MVSIGTTKRYRMDPVQDISKRSRLATQTDIPLIISMHSSYHSENLSRLKVLYPNKTLEELSKLLEDSNNSFEFAVFNIQKQEQERYKEAVKIKKAQEIVVALTAAKTMHEALDIAVKYVEVNDESSESKEAVKENEVLKEHIKQMTDENKILKKAVTRLHECVKDAPDKEREIEKLRKEVESERCKSFMLSAQLNQALNSQYIRPSRELY